MPDPRAVRRLKGQPDRWRRTVRRSDVVEIRVNLTAARARLDGLRLTPEEADRVRGGLANFGANMRRLGEMNRQPTAEAFKRFLEARRG